MRGHPVRAVLVGALHPLGAARAPSGIDKRPVDGAVAVTALGLAGDRQGDPVHHGGPDKAVHHYAFDHYALWRTESPGLEPRLRRPGAFGENISTTGMTEAEVCIGDLYRLGTALVEVSQGRQPCWKLNERFGDPTMARRVQANGRAGWYYRVVEEGRVEAGDAIRLVERPAGDWTLLRVLDLLYRDMLNIERLTALAAIPQLGETWRVLARRRIERRAVESWARRLEAPDALSDDPASAGGSARNDR